MRTTLTLDADLAPQLERLRKVRGVSRARLMNSLLRAGLASAERRPAARRPYRLRKAFEATNLVGSLDRVSEVLELGEGPAHR